MVLNELIKKKDYEEVLHVLRRHPITFFPQIIFLMVIFIAPFILFSIFQILNPNLLNNTFIYTLLIFVFGIFYLLSILIFYIHFIDYYLDVWIVTNDRIIDIEQFGLFSRTVSEVDLFRIQDVTSTVHGIFPTFFNYGDLHIKTASSNIDVIFRKIKDPNIIREQLIKLSDTDRKHHYSDEKLAVS